jgi:selenophosphate synthase
MSRKRAPGDLESILSGLAITSDENVLIGTITADDGGVSKIFEELALIQTVNFLLPLSIILMI